MGEGIVMRPNQRSWRPGGALPAWLLAFACVLAGASVGAVQARELRGWSVHADDYPVNQGMQQFAQAVGRISAGQHTARVYGNAQLAPQGKVLEEMGSGAIDFAEIGVAGYGDRVAALQVLGLPYLFHDSEQMFALLDGELGRLLSTELRKYDGGTRNFYHRSKPLRRVSDFHGEKLCVGVKFHAGGDAGPMVRRMRPLYEPPWASPDPLSRQALGLVLKSRAGR